MKKLTKYGIDRDFSALVPAGHNPFTAHKLRSSTPVAAAPEPAADEAQRFREWNDRRNEKRRRARAAGNSPKTITERVLRVNPHSHICEPSGFAVHKAEIRKEMAGV